MRLSLFSQWWYPENANLVGSLATELARRGAKLEVVTGFPNYPMGKIFGGYRLRPRQIENTEHWRLVRVPLYPSHDRSAIGRALNYTTFGIAATLVGLVSLQRSDVAYVYHPTLTSAWPARVQRRLRKIPFVLHVQDLWPDSVMSSGMVRGRPGQLAERMLTRMCENTYRSASHIVVISAGMKSILELRGVPASKITVVLNWADDDVFKVEISNPAVRAQMAPSDKRIVLYAGNMGDFQGLEAVIRAAAALRHRTDLHLTLVGDGLARPTLEALVAELNAENVTLLPGRRAADIVPFLAAADAHLVSLVDLPFFAATIPGKTAVALASGKFTIMAVRGDAANIIDKAGAGLTCEPNEAGILAAFEQFSVMTNDEIQRRGAAGRAYYDDHMSLTRGADRFEKIFERCRRPGPEVRLGEVSTNQGLPERREMGGT